MLPRDLTPDHFAKYPPRARSLAVAHLAVLRQLPLSFVPSLLRQCIEYDSMFPAESAGFEKELVGLSALTPVQIGDWFQLFYQIRLSASQEKFDWLGQPAQFVEQLSSYLWSTHQMDLFRSAATAYRDRIRGETVAEPLPLGRLGIAVIGQGVTFTDKKLFRNLREHGTYFDQINPDRGLELLLAVAEKRAQAYPAPYSHWYVDGGSAAQHSPLLTCISYDALMSTRQKLLADIQRKVQQPGMGPEALHSHLARILPGEVGLSNDSLLDRFQVKLLTEGSGTQIFSTTFAQWAAREALRRAQPLTLLVRFAPRQRDRPMSELLSSSPGTPEVDPLGSLIDADMGAYYHWINQQRLAHSEKSSFLVWLEGQNQAFAIGPSMPRGVESTSYLPLSSLCSLIA